jgi:hypothetical protein
MTQLESILILIHVILGTVCQIFRTADLEFTHRRTSKLILVILSCSNAEVIIFLYFMEAVSDMNCITAQDTIGTLCEICRPLCSLPPSITNGHTAAPCHVVKVPPLKIKVPPPQNEVPPPLPTPCRPLAALLEPTAAPLPPPK